VCIHIRTHKYRQIRKIPRVTHNLCQFLYNTVWVLQPWNVRTGNHMFPQLRQNYHFPGQSTQDLEVINQDTCKKHIIFIQYMIDYWHFYGTASSPLLAVWSIHFYLYFNYHGISRQCTSICFLLHSKFSSTCLIFIQVDFFTGNIFSRTFPDFAKFNDISRTWKMNLLFSRFSRTHRNPVIISNTSLY